MSHHSSIAHLRVRRQVKSLVELCIDCLHNHLESIGELGVIEPKLLVRVLSVASASELERIEKLNKPLVGSLDILWRDHAIKARFIDKSVTTPKPFGSWRQLYNKKREEEEKNKKMLGSKLRDLYAKDNKEKEKRKIHLVETVPTVSRAKLPRTWSGGGSGRSSSSSSSSSFPSSFSSTSSSSSYSSASNQPTGRLMAATRKEMQKKLNRYGKK